MNRSSFDKIIRKKRPSKKDIMYINLYISLSKIHFSHLHYILNGVNNNPCKNLLHIPLLVISVRRKSRRNIVHKDSKSPRCRISRVRSSAYLLSLRSKVHLCQDATGESGFITHVVNLRVFA